MADRVGGGWQKNEDRERRRGEARTCMSRVLARPPSQQRHIPSVRMISGVSVEGSCYCNEVINEHVGVTTVNLCRRLALVADTAGSTAFGRR